MNYTLALTGDIFHIFTEAGTFNLFYKIENDQLLIKNEYQYDFGYPHSTDEYAFNIQDPSLSDKQILRNFLIEKLDTGFFSEQVIRQESIFFSSEELEEINHLARQERKEKEERAKMMHQNKEIIKFCEREQMNPRLAGLDPDQWFANCPGGRHPLMIAADSGTWGCGYCEKKGELPELEQWVRERK